MLRKIKNFFRLLYEKLVLINDTPQKISLGLALGVSLGIIPGTGPIAAVTAAFVLRLNRMAALIGSLMVNTWLSIVTLILAVKLGAMIFAINWQELYRQWLLIFSQFQMRRLLESSFYEIILPTFVGYVIISLVCGILVYLVSILILRRIRHGNKG